MYENRSMAVWCPVRENHFAASAELHFNLWRLPKRGWIRKLRNLSWANDADFIEIGVLLDNPDQIKEICIFLPFAVSRSEVEDCGPRFRDESIAEGIFNEQISVEIPAVLNGAFVELKIGGNIFCRVHEFEKSSDLISDNHLKVQKEGHGTLLKVSTSAVNAPANSIPVGGKSYFRLRVQLPQPSESPFIQQVKPSDWALQSGFEGIELINFRLNEMRTLPSVVQNQLRDNGIVKNARIRLIAFLTAVPAISDMASSSTPSHKSRTLEREIWDKYVKNGLPDDVAVYHWKKSRSLENGEEPISDFSAFVKLKQRRAGLGTVAIYLTIAFAFGVLGNLTASWIETRGQVHLSSQEDIVKIEQTAPEAKSD